MPDNWNLHCAWMMINTAFNGQPCTRFAEQHSSCRNVSSVPFSLSNPSSSSDGLSGAGRCPNLLATDTKIKRSLRGTNRGTVEVTDLSGVLWPHRDTAHWSRTMMVRNKGPLKIILSLFREKKLRLWSWLKISWEKLWAWD